MTALVNSVYFKGLKLYILPMKKYPRNESIFETYSHALTVIRLLVIGYS